MLTCLAFAQPLLSTLGRNPSFLIAHNARLTDVSLLFLAVVLVPAAFALLLEWIIAKYVSGGAADTTHEAFIAFFSAIWFLVGLKNVWPHRSRSLIVMALVLGAGFAYCYARWLRPKLSLALLSPVLLLFPAAFIAKHDVRSALFPARIAVEKVRASAPVVLVVFDEFPLSSLLNANAEIDARYFPNFARLSRETTWFRNATAVGDDTIVAVPAILDGVRPDAAHRKLPHATDHPHSLFTLLGGTYRMNVHEHLTHVCPESLCSAAANASLLARTKLLFTDSMIVVLHVIVPERYAGGLPDISQAWSGFGAPAAAANNPSIDEDAPIWDDRSAQVRDFIASIKADSKPSLNFLHVLLPHEPYAFLPSGQRYLPSAEIRIRGVLNNLDWSTEPGAAKESYIRYLWQAQFVDKLTGELVDHLKQVGLYDASLIVVTADHGASFRPGQSRRYVTEGNKSDILWVPLFIKVPYQKRGGTDDRNVESVDILPTVADALGVPLPSAVSGESLIGTGWKDRGRKSIGSMSGQTLTTNAAMDGLKDSLDFKLSTFPGWDTDGGVFADSREPGLLGRRADIATVSALTCRLDSPALFQAVRTHSGIIPAEIKGTIDQASGAAVRLAIAINGVIRGTASPYSTSQGLRFSFLVPPASFHDGFNRVEVFSIGDSRAR